MALIHFETLGCRLNQDETEGAAYCFSKAGFAIDLENLTAASAVLDSCVLGIINTCTVTGKAEQKARRIMRLMLEKLPRAVLLVTGCYAELGAEEIRAIAPKRICILKGTNKSLLARIAVAMAADDNGLSVSGGRFNAAALADFISRQGTAPLLRPAALLQMALPQNPFTLYTSSFVRHSRASLKIQDGCNNACTFCRIHLARGKALSLDVAEVLHRVRQLAGQGVHELVFTGVNLSQYAGLCDDGSRVSFAQLLGIVLRETEGIRFRISSFYPQHVTEELCEQLSSPRVQPSFHLSVQSGSDRILSLMARPYSAAAVERAASLLRQAKAEPFLSCDIIAGFPGETEEDFSATRALCERVHFAWIHAFPFSPRPGTPAAAMKPQVAERIKGERVKLLSALAQQEKLAYIRSFAGRELSAIVENSRALRCGLGTAGTFHAVTENFLHVSCKAAVPPSPGSLVRVRLGTPLEESILSGGEVDAEAELISALVASKLRSQGF